MRFLVFSLVLIASASALDVKFKDCGSSLAKDIVISVTPCETQPCPLKHNANYTIGIAFTPDSASANIKSLIYGVVDGIPVPFPFDKPDACQDSGLTCPLKSGVAVKYTATLPIKSEYPAIKLYVKWELEDTDAGKDLVCAEIPCAVVSGNSDDQYRNKVVSRHWYED